MREILQTINSTSKIEKIANAMQLVAASRLGKARERFTQTKPYAEKMKQVIAHVAASHSEYHHPFLTPREHKRAVALVVVSTDKGLCGSLNHHLFRQVVQDVKAYQAQDIAVKLVLLGRKAVQFFSQVGGQIHSQLVGISEKTDEQDLMGIVKTVLDEYTAGHIDAVELYHNSFINVMTQKPEHMTMVPLATETPASHWDYIYEPDAVAILDVLLKRYIETMVSQAVSENIACEHAARMIAMKSATDNSKNIIADLRLAYNKARQAAITSELAEIVAGSDAIDA